MFTWRQAATGMLTTLSAANLRRYHGDSRESA
jgi:hypothetical protein